MNKINLLSHNWLALKINNDSFQKDIHFIKGRVIDLGCGTSQYKTDILKVANEYIGVDWKNSLHDQSNVDIFANLCERLPLEDEYADTVVSFQVMEHLAEPNFFLVECNRILKGGGHLFITVPFMWHVHEAPNDHYRYTKYGLEYMLTKAGFNNVEIVANTGFWTTWILKFNYHSKRFIRGPVLLRRIIEVILILGWFTGQMIAPIMDKFDKNEDETASYTVKAMKM